MTSEQELWIDQTGATGITRFKIADLVAIESGDKDGTDTLDVHVSKKEYYHIHQFRGTVCVLFERDYVTIS